MFTITRNLIITTITVMAFGTSSAFAQDDNDSSCKESLSSAAESCGSAALDAASMAMDIESGDAASLGMDGSNFEDDAKQCAGDIKEAWDACIN